MLKLLDIKKFKNIEIREYIVLLGRNSEITYKRKDVVLGVVSIEPLVVVDDLGRFNKVESYDGYHSVRCESKYERARLERHVSIWHTIFKQHIFLHNLLSREDNKGEFRVNLAYTHNLNTIFMLAPKELKELIDIMEIKVIDSCSVKNKEKISKLLLTEAELGYRCGTSHCNNTTIQISGDISSYKELVNLM